MNLFKISDKIVFSSLNNIKYGYLEITNHDGEFFKFGNPNDQLKANLKIKKTNFFLRFFSNKRDKNTK